MFGHPKRVFNQNLNAFIYLAFFVFLEGIVFSLLLMVLVWVKVCTCSKKCNILKLCYYKILEWLLWSGWGPCNCTVNRHIRTRVCKFDECDKEEQPKVCPDNECSGRRNEHFDWQKLAELAPQGCSKKQIPEVYPGPCKHLRWWALQP